MKFITMMMNILMIGRHHTTELSMWLLNFDEDENLEDWAQLNDISLRTLRE